MIEYLKNQIYNAVRTGTLKFAARLKGLYLAIFCLVLISLQASAQQSQQANDVILERLNSIEGENKRLREDINDLKSKNDELKSKEKDLEDDLKEFEPFKFWAWILGGLGVTSILGLAWLYFKVIPNKVTNQVDAVITKILTDRREDFLGLLKEYDFEKSVKQRHQIVLLGHKDRDISDDYHYRMLSKNGFQVKSFTNLDQLQDAEFTSEDIIVINNDGSHWTIEQIQEFISANPNYCFYFGKGIINAEGNRLDRFAAANFRTQFIGNLMNVLKYSHHQN